MIPRRTSLRSTLDALSQALVDAVLLAVRRTPLTELADVLDVAPSRASMRLAAPTAGRAPRRDEAPPSSAPARSQRPRRAPPAAPRQLELPLDPPNAYPEATIVDPEAVLGALQPRQKTSVLGALEPVQEAQQTPREAAHDPEGTASSRRAPKRATRRRQVASIVEAAPVPVLASRTARDPIAPPGEEVLRAAGGGVVLRRRRSPNPSAQ